MTAFATLVGLVQENYPLSAHQLLDPHLCFQISQLWSLYFENTPLS